jgi:hypothetical protein
MAKGMLEAVIGAPELDDEEDAPSEAEDPKAKKKRAIRALMSAFKSSNADAAAEAFADAVDACLEYESPED